MAKRANFEQAKPSQLQPASLARAFAWQRNAPPMPNRAILLAKNSVAVWENFPDLESRTPNFDRTAIRDLKFQGKIARQNGDLMRNASGNSSRVARWDSANTANGGQGVCGGALRVTSSRLLA
jgi:hypothetical protein